MFDIAVPPVRSRLLEKWDSWRLPVSVAVAYYVGAESAFLVGTLSDKIFAPFWPPNIVLFYALLVTPRHRWWLCIMAAFPAHLIAEARVGMAMPQMLVAFATNCVFADLCTVGVQRFVGGPPRFNEPRKALLFIFITSFAAPAIAALGGAFVEVAGGGAIANYPSYWVHWYGSNALGSLTLGSFVLIWMGEGRKLFSGGWGSRQVEALLLGVALVVVCVVAFDYSAGWVANDFTPALLYLPLPLIIWSAVRYGAAGASATNLLITVVLIWRVLNGATLFAGSDAETNVFAVQLFLIGLSAPTLLLGSAIDQARNAWQLMRESEERMTFAAASAKTGLWEHCLVTGDFWATDYCRTLFDLPPTDIITQKALLQVVHPEDYTIAAAVMNEAAAGAEPAFVEFRIQTARDQTRWIIGRRRVQRDERGRPARISGIFADLTDRKMSEAEAQQRRQEVAHLMRVALLGRLSGAIAHELNQPLTAILSNAQAARLMLSQKTLNLPEIGGAIDDIVTEDSRASEVISRLRGLLKKGEVKYETTDITDLIRSTCQLLRSEIASRNIKLDIAFAENMPLIYGDPIQLQQVVLNLIMNAMEAVGSAAAACRVITVRTTLPDTEHVEVTIADRGSGIAVEYQTRLFEPFFTTKDHGLGLGLSICSSIVTSHGGKLDIVNDTDGGAVATVILPTRKVAKVESGI